jgi:hypothetical protein
MHYKAFVSSNKRMRLIGFYIRIIGNKVYGKEFAAALIIFGLKN